MFLSQKKISTFSFSSCFLPLRYRLPFSFVLLLYFYLFNIKIFNIVNYFFKFYSRKKWMLANDRPRRTCGGLLFFRPRKKQSVGGCGDVGKAKKNLQQNNPFPYILQTCNEEKTRNVSTVHGCPRCGVPDYKTANFYLIQIP